MWETLNIKVSKGWKRRNNGPTKLVVEGLDVLGCVAYDSGDNLERGTIITRNRRRSTRWNWVGGGGRNRSNKTIEGYEKENKHGGKDVRHDGRHITC